MDLISTVFVSARPIVSVTPQASCNGYEMAAEARVRCMSLLGITVEVSFQPGNITLILIST